jgi:cell wall-associated NlpC family hydrolase
MPAPAAAAVVGIAKKKVIAKIVKIVIGLVVFTIIGSAAFFTALSQTMGAICNDPAGAIAVGSDAGLPAAGALPGAATSAAGDPDPAELAKFMWAKRQLESGQNYTITSKYSTASGAYQYIDSTWQAPAHRAIWSRYGDFPRAYMAPPNVQDEVAKSDFVSAWHTYHNWSQVAMSHYVPAWTADPRKWDEVPGGGGNTLTLRQYANKVLTLMGKASDAPAGTDSATLSCQQNSNFAYTGDGTAGSLAVKSAVKYIGIGYKWGGGHAPGSQFVGMDCSGFTFNAYRDLGITIGMTTSYQVNDGISMGTSLSNARPGDLILIGRSRGDTSHVVMYYGYENGQHMVIESSGRGSECTANNPTFGSNPNCKGIDKPHPYHDNRDIVDIRRIVCSVGANGQAVACGAAPAA